MPSEARPPTHPMNLMGELMMAQAQGAMALFGQMLPGRRQGETSGADAGKAASAEALQWADAATRLQAMWTDFQVEQLARVTAAPPPSSTPASG